jgi:glycosyltransferase involved in cell wall biosynthesis
MALGRCVVVNDTQENLETIADAGFSYEGSVGAPSLRAVLERLLKDPAIVQEFGARAQDRVREHYSWEAVTDAYEQLFQGLLSEAP